MCDIEVAQSLLHLLGCFAPPLAKRLVRGRIVTVGRGPLPNKLLHFQWNAHRQLHSATPKCTLEDGYSVLERIREKKRKSKRASLDFKSWKKNPAVGFVESTLGLGPVWKYLHSMVFGAGRQVDKAPLRVRLLRGRDLFTVTP